eukprot:4182400-Pyramimonas_sp.AAC.1
MPSFSRTWSDPVPNDSAERRNSNTNKKSKTSAPDWLPPGPAAGPRWCRKLAYPLQLTLLTATPNPHSTPPRDCARDLKELGVRLLPNKQIAKRIDESRKK